MEQDNSTRRGSSQVYRWVIVAGYAVCAGFLVALGQVLVASVFATMGLAMLVEATRLDERSALARRLGLILVMVSAVLAVIYAYTSLFT
ncbi:hypothetical protein BH24ACT22_BH24ACT22_12820 [soil metagenome]